MLKFRKNGGRHQVPSSSKWAASIVNGKRIRIFFMVTLENLANHKILAYNAKKKGILPRENVKMIVNVSLLVIKVTVYLK